MPYCPQCGSENRESAKFCESCGTELDPNVGDTGSVSSSDEPDETPSLPEEQKTSEGINWVHVTIAGGLAIIPAFAASVTVSIAANSAVGWVFFVGLLAFGYLIYQRPTPKTMVGGMCFWLGIEAFLAPVALLVFTMTFASQEATTTVGGVGAAIGGFFMIIVAFLVGVPLGIVLYLISHRLDTDERRGERPTGKSGQTTS